MRSSTSIWPKTSKTTRRGNLFVIFGEPDIDLLPEDMTASFESKDVSTEWMYSKPQTGEVGQ